MFGDVSMDCCKYNGEIIFAEDCAETEETERKVWRKLSKKGLLYCNDPDCNSRVYYKHGDKKKPHFTHEKGHKECSYLEHDKTENEEERAVKKILFDFCKNKYNIEIDKKIYNDYFAPLVLKFENENELIIEIGSKMTSSSKLDRIEGINSNNKLQWIFAGNIIYENNEKNCCMLKRFLLQHKNTLYVIDCSDRKIQASRLLSYDSRIIFSKTYTLNDIIINESGVVIPQFEDDYSKIIEEHNKKSERKTASYSIPKKSTNIGSASVVNNNNQFRSTYEIKKVPDIPPFAHITSDQIAASAEKVHQEIILKRAKDSIESRTKQPSFKSIKAQNEVQEIDYESITIPDTQSTIEFSKKKFKELIDEMINTYNQSDSAFRRLLNKLYLANENEKNIFENLYSQYILSDNKIGIKLLNILISKTI